MVSASNRGHAPHRDTAGTVAPPRGSGTHIMQAAHKTPLPPPRPPRCAQFEAKLNN